MYAMIMVTFTINISPMLAYIYIPYMDSMGLFTLEDTSSKNSRIEFSQEVDPDDKGTIRRRTNYGYGLVLGAFFQ